MSESPAVSTSMESLGRLQHLARTAGAAIMAHYESGGAATLKSDGSPITLADRAAQKVIVEALEEWDPSIPIIAEEAEVAPYQQRKSWHRFWLVDPLDGTKEFLSRNGEFTVNIALIEDREPTLGVVYAPAMDLMFAAGRRLGAWRSENGGDQSRVYSRTPRNGGPLTVVESRSHGSAELEQYLQTIQVAGRMQLGSSLKFCVVAEGRADIYPRLGPTMEWDVAAGDCVYRNSAPEGQNPSTLTYNKPDLRNDSFVLGIPC